eukprot:s107_g2.t1
MCVLQHVECALRLFEHPASSLEGTMLDAMPPSLSAAVISYVTPALEVVSEDVLSELVLLGLILNAHLPPLAWKSRAPFQAWIPLWKMRPSLCLSLL